MNVAEGDAEMLLDFFGSEGKDIDDTVFKAGRELVGDVQQVIDVTRLFIFPFPAAGNPAIAQHL